MIDVNGGHIAPGHDRDRLFNAISMKAGTPGWIRTSYPRLRRPMLYPYELRGHILSFNIHVPQGVDQVKSTIATPPYPA